MFLPVPEQPRRVGVHARGSSVRANDEFVEGHSRCSYGVLVLFDTKSRNRAEKRNSWIEMGMIGWRPSMENELSLCCPEVGKTIEITGTGYTTASGTRH